MLHGNVTLDELMSRLLAAHEQYTAQLAVEISEEEAREARDAVKREQDLAFEMSLMVSRVSFFGFRNLVLAVAVKLKKITLVYRVFFSGIIFQNLDSGSEN